MNFGTMTHHGRIFHGGQHLM